MNRGADFVKYLALPRKRVRTRHLTRLRSPDVRRRACSHPSCSRVSAADSSTAEKKQPLGVGCLFFIGRWTFDVQCSTFIRQNNPYGTSVTCERLQNSLVPAGLPGAIFLLLISLVSLMRQYGEFNCSSHQRLIGYVPYSLAASYIAQMFSGLTPAWMLCTAVKI